MKRYSGPNMAMMVADPDGYLVLAADHDAEIARLREEIRRLHDSIEMLESLPGNEQAARWRAEIARLREALAECVVELDNYTDAQYPGDHPHFAQQREYLRSVNPARLALNPEVDHD